MKDELLKCPECGSSEVTVYINLIRIQRENLPHPHCCLKGNIKQQDHFLSVIRVNASLNAKRLGFVGRLPLAVGLDQAAIAFKHRIGNSPGVLNMQRCEAGQHAQSFARRESQAALVCFQDWRTKQGWHIKAAQLFTLRGTSLADSLHLHKLTHALRNQRTLSVQQINLPALPFAIIV